MNADGLGEKCSLAVDANGDPTDLDFHLPAFLLLRGPYAVRRYDACARATRAAVRMTRRWCCFDCSGWGGLGPGAPAVEAQGSPSKTWCHQSDPAQSGTTAFSTPTSKTEAPPAAIAQSHTRSNGGLRNPSLCVWMMCRCATLQSGTPMGTCSETAPNSTVFTREYSKATVKVDCTKLQGQVTMK